MGLKVIHIPWKSGRCSLAFNNRRLGSKRSAPNSRWVNGRDDFIGERQWHSLLLICMGLVKQISDSVFTVALLKSWQSGAFFDWRSEVECVARFPLRRFGISSALLAKSTHFPTPIRIVYTTFCISMSGASLRRRAPAGVPCFGFSTALSASAVYRPIRRQI